MSQIGQKLADRAGSPAAAKLPNPDSNGQTPKNKPRPVGNKELTYLTALLDIEAAGRKAATLQEWHFVIANETRKVTRARQIFVFRGVQKQSLKAISGMSNFERSTKLVCDVEHIVAQTIESGGEKITQIDLAEFPQNNDKLLSGYPFGALIWVPFLSRSGELIGGMVLASDQPWLDGDMVILKRLADTFGHCLEALIATTGSVGQLSAKFLPRKSTWLIGLMALIAVLFIPVSMSTLAPFEVAPRSPVIVAAPLAGVIEDVLVLPNSVVKKGQVILTFADTILKNKLDLAEKEIFVAAAELKKASQLAFDESRGQQDLRIAIANHSLKVSERNFARKMYERTTIKAEKSGVVLYADQRTLIGRPVVLGERIMQIADPAKVELLIDVSVNDAILLNGNARVKIFLDSDPVHPREAMVNYIDYKARGHNGQGDQMLSFRVVASLKDVKARLPRLGVRGTAKLYGEDVALAFYLFRRPLAAMRQWIGI